MIEAVMVRACAVAGIKAEAPFPRMNYKDAVRKYGSDKPDMRFGMELHEVTEAFPAEAIAKLQIEGNVFAFAAPGAAGYSRKQLDELAEKAKAAGARGAYFVKVAAEGTTSTVEKLIGAENVKKIAELCGAKTGDLVVAVSAREQIKGTEAAALVAGQLRLQLGEALGAIDKTQWKFLWLTGFPLFEWSNSDKTWVSAQHPFTGIVDEDLEKLESAPWEVRSKGYDLVLNGVELGFGQHSNSSAGSAAAIVQGAGADGRAAAAALWIFSGCADVWNSSARRHRVGTGSRGDVAGGRKVDSRSDRVRQDDGGSGSDGGISQRSGQRAARSIGDRPR